MALSELAAVEAAYQVLHPLDAAGRRRALQWLSDALSAEGPLPESPPGTATPAGRADGPGGPPGGRNAPPPPRRRRPAPHDDAPAPRPRRRRPRRAVPGGPGLPGRP